MKLTDRQIEIISNMGNELDEAQAKADRQAIAIRAAIKKLEGPGMPDRAREAIHILLEAVDED